MLIATLRGPLNPPVKGIDGRRFVGPQRFIANLPDEQIEPFDAVVNLLTAKYDQRQEDISASTVASQLKMVKQDGKSVDEYIARYEDTRDRVPALQLAVIMTNYAHVENFVSGLDPPLLRLYVQENRVFRNETWEETIKKVRETEVKLKLGEGPIEITDGSTSETETRVIYQQI